MGRKAPRLLEQAGLVDTTIESVTVIDRDYAAFSKQYDLKRIVQRAIEVAAVSTEAGAAWLAAIEKQAAEGYFFSSVTSFIISGRKR